MNSHMNYHDTETSFFHLTCNIWVILEHNIVHQWFSDLTTYNLKAWPILLISLSNAMCYMWLSASSPVLSRPDPQ